MEGCIRSSVAKYQTIDRSWSDPLRPEKNLSRSFSFPWPIIYPRYLTRYHHCDSIREPFQEVFRFGGCLEIGIG